MTLLSSYSSITFLLHISFVHTFVNYVCAHDFENVHIYKNAIMYDNGFLCGCVCLSTFFRSTESGTRLKMYFTSMNPIHNIRLRDQFANLCSKIIQVFTFMLKFSRFNMIWKSEVRIN